MELATVDHTQPSIRRDFVEWHRGRSPFVFWALDLDGPELRARVAGAAAHLAPWLLDAYCRQPHVTLDICGFPALLPAVEDEFDQAFCLAQVVRLKAAVIGPFRLRIGTLESFASAAYLAVADGQGALAAIRACLAGGQGNRLFGSYVPHVTVGLYGGAWPAGEVLGRIQGFPAAQPLEIAVDRVSLMAYCPSDIGGVLSCLGDYRLDVQRMDWRIAPERLWRPASVRPA